MPMKDEKIRVTIKLFASFREAVGSGDLTWELPSGATLDELIRTLDQAYPQAGFGRRAFHMAVNHEYASMERTLQDGDEVAIFPPVSGGTDAKRRDVYELTHEPLQLDAFMRRVVPPSCGAVATFIGTVRDHTGDRQVSHLVYEAYPGMAEKMLAQIGEEIRERWPSIQAVGIQHRLGKVDIGEASVIIVTAAAHRPDVFDACRYAIERIKAVVPIWKKEVYIDGEAWVEGPHGTVTDPPPREDKRSAPT